MKAVILESPYSGLVPLNVAYLRACLRDSVLRGESPYASHALLTQPGVLRDEVLDEREAGIAAGFVWRPLAALTVFYENLGWSGGMNRALEDCEARKLPYERRTLGAGWLVAHLEREQIGTSFFDWTRRVSPEWLP